MVLFIGMAGLAYVQIRIMSRNANAQGAGMAIRNRRAKWLLRTVSVPMVLLALSCIYPVLFTVNNALKTNKGYILDRFGVVVAPSLENYYAAWKPFHLGVYLMNSVTLTTGAAALLLLTS